MRLIDADALHDSIDKETYRHTYIEQIHSIIDNAPTIEAEPVVRCKECDSYVEVAWWFDDEGKKKECHCCAAHSIPVQPNDFCSYGERREP